MRNRIIASTLLLLSTLTPHSWADSSITVSELNCEYQINPLAIDTDSPRLAWKLTSPARNQKQMAYRVLVASNEEKLKNDTGDLWDSGKVDSDQSIQIPYTGKSLVSFQRVYWKVRVWDQDNQPSPWSEIATWSMGILKEEDWDAHWIGRSEPEAKEQKLPLPLFRKKFSVDKPIKHARIYICGLGFYELRLNGSKVGESMFDPGWSNYHKTCLYAAYDITEQIKLNDNTLGVMLGNGMYNVPGGRYTKFTGSFGPLQFILKLHIEYEDGSVSDVVSDPAWRSSSGPITFTCIYGGEDYDARLEQPGWDMPGFEDSKWTPVKVSKGPGGRLTAQSAPPIRVQETIAPVNVTEPTPGIKVYDLGQNFSGIPSIQVRGVKGASIRITPAELITDRGLANQSASGGPHTYTYILKGEGTESWQPRFTYYGFRYLQVELSPSDHSPELIKIEGLFTRNSSSRAGQFECSSELYNQIAELIDWSVGSNFQSVLTDCPHREKLGWLEVAHLMAPSILYNYDAPTFYNKVTRDIRDSQLENGLIPDIAPEYVVFSQGFRDSPEWGSAGVILPWTLYEWFGDVRALQENYEAMKRYVQYLAERSEENIVSHGLGDWFDYVRGDPVGESRLTPKSLTATAMFYRDAVILRNTAELLDRPEDQKQYTELAERIRQSFNQKLFHPDANQYATGSQTANAIPLVWNLVDSDRYDAVLQNLVNEVTTRDYLTSGDVGFRFLLRALADNGRSDLVYRLTHRTDEPGYGYQLQQGATSLTEAWDGRKVVSHNHCMLGHLQEWFHQDLLGIRRDPSSVAFQKIIIQPHPVGEIKWAKGFYDSPYGKINCHWQIENSKFTLDINVPVNTTALVFIPSKNPEQITENTQSIDKTNGIEFVQMTDSYSIYRVGSGHYSFASEYER